jgi:hypothetical protein
MLRSQFLARSSIASHAELIALLRQGMAAWMAHDPPKSCRQASVAAAVPTPTDRVTGELQAAVAQVLASMALCQQQELHQ